MPSKRSSPESCLAAVPAGEEALARGNSCKEEDPPRGRSPRPRAAEAAPSAKRRRLARDHGDDGDDSRAADFFDRLPDDLVLCILRRLSFTAPRPADLLGVHMTCKRLRSLALHPVVLSRASPRALAPPAAKWSEFAHSFLKRCAEAGNLEACYILGMIRFYCLGNRPGGLSLLARAAMRQHAVSLYSLAVIQFNGSGSQLKSSKNLRAGVVLCARAASLGHVDALRELGHCLQDGYGVRREVARGRRFLVQANAREIANALRGIPNGFARLLAARKKQRQEFHLQQQRHQQRRQAGQNPGAIVLPSPLLSDFGCHLLPAPHPHPANRFLSEWFAMSGPAGGGGQEDLRMCSHATCGRPETRRHEFRRCSVCGKANYCSRACQALDWRFHHRHECVPMPRLAPVPVPAPVPAPVVPLVQIPADGGAGAAEAAAASAANGAGYAAAG